MQIQQLHRGACTLALVSTLVLAGCGRDSDDGATTTSRPGPTAPSGISAAETEAAMETYADLVVASYDASIASAKTMRQVIEAFLAAPTAETLAAAKTAWLTARDDYLPTEAFRFYDGPIDNPDDGPEGQINAWPMDEAYIDYVVDDPDAGIINNAAEFPQITTAVLVDQNENGGETNISTGWHAIEFLIWGQDRTAGSPGARPVTDYTTSPTAARRSAYLRTATNQLVADLTGVRDQWDPESGAYRTEFLSDPKAALADALRGIGALSSGELAGERIAVALETKDQEDEHSCFSDNTNADIVGDLVGVQQVYLADFPGVDGPSISDLVKKADPALDTKLTGQIEKSLQLSEALPAPFEELIVGADTAPGRVALTEALTSIEDQGNSIAEVATALGVKITLEV